MIPTTLMEQNNPKKEEKQTQTKKEENKKEEIVSPPKQTQPIHTNNPKTPNLEIDKKDLDGDLEAWLDDMI